MAELPSDFDLAPYIEHSLLDPAATLQQIEQLCQEADRYHFAAVCVFPWVVRQAREWLNGRSPRLCTVIDFPNGASTAASKCFAAQEAVENGAQELNVVVNLGWLRSDRADLVHQELAEIVEATGVPIKAILEATRLNPSELEQLTDLCLDAGITMLQTSTGWFGGATPALVQQLRQLTRNRVGIHAAGGIRTWDQAADLIEAGAVRLGTSYGPLILQQRLADAAVAASV
ncbi:deoxyribose-phosphate aldolase [Synechococcus elongatus IITB7]|uniref:deoxyribose-phosphate aldolase n=1 Tax=Synechococcus elongatus TaxID=32046 RepID=UPI0030CE1904